MFQISNIEEDKYSINRMIGSPASSFKEGPDHFLDINKPRILLTGLHRSGKSSIQKVVFQKMPPSDTLFLDYGLGRDGMSNNTSFINLQIWDYPGDAYFDGPLYEGDSIFGPCDALVFVIDAQDDYLEALDKLQIIVTKAYISNPKIECQVFVHKVDGLHDDHKVDVFHDIVQRATQDFTNEEFQNNPLSFHLTSIYDYSIFEAISKVAHKIIPHVPTLESLLDIFTSNSEVAKTFLFDVASKIYIATDSAPFDMQTYEFCCDSIDAALDVTTMYGLQSDSGRNAFDSQLSSVLQMDSGIVILLRAVNKYFALISIIHEDKFVRQGLIDFNFHCIRQSIEDIFKVKIHKNNNGFQSKRRCDK